MPSPPLFQASPSLFLYVISTCPFIFTRIHRLHYSPHSGREEGSRGRFLKGLVPHEIHPIVRSNRLFWIKAWDKILRSWWQKVPQKRFLESLSPILSRTLGQIGQPKSKVPLSLSFFFLLSFFSLVPYFVRIYNIYILFFSTFVLVLALQLNMLNDFHQSICWLPQLSLFV